MSGVTRPIEMVVYDGAVEVSVPNEARNADVGPTNEIEFGRALV